MTQDELNNLKDGEIIYGVDDSLQNCSVQTLKFGRISNNQIYAQQLTRSFRIHELFITPEEAREYALIIENRKIQNYQNQIDSIKENIENSKSNIEKLKNMTYVDYRKIPAREHK